MKSTDNNEPEEDMMIDKKSDKKETKKDNVSKREPINSLKGMSDRTGDRYYQMQGMFEKAQEIAEYYGFKPIETPAMERTSVFVSGIGEGTDVVDKEMYRFSLKGGESVTLRPEYTAGIMRSYIENGMGSLPQPIMLYSYGPLWRHENPQKGRLREFYQFDLEILGSDKSIADALIIKTLHTILNEFGFDDLIVEINSMGDKDGRPAYIKALTNYYKKYIDKMCRDCQERLKNNPLRLLDCKNELCLPLKEKAPQSISYLSSDSRKHFMQVLQYLEEMGIQYRINHSLVRGLAYYSHTVFEIVKVDTDESGKERDITITGGGRYDYLARELGSKKDVPSVGTALGFERIMLFPECKQIMPRIIKTPKIYFIQLGFEAKLKSLQIIEVLRKAKIPVYQSITKDSLGAQLSMAEKMNIPNTIIFGQKEAMDGTVIVRNMSTHSQDTIAIADLCDYIKHLK